MTTTTFRMTPGRKRGLQACALHRRALESNTTDLSLGLIYWSTARSLSEHGLIELDPTVALRNCWVLTDAGRQLATDLGLQIREAG